MVCPVTSLMDCGGLLVAWSASFVVLTGREEEEAEFSGTEEGSSSLIEPCSTRSGSEETSKCRGRFAGRAEDGLAFIMTPMLAFEC